MATIDWLSVTLGTCLGVTIAVIAALVGTRMLVQMEKHLRAHAELLKTRQALSFTGSGRIVNGKFVCDACRRDLFPEVRNGD